jgi:CBS domain-containing protein
MPRRKLIPDVIRNQDITAFTPDTPVLTAVKTMAERRIGAVLVEIDGKLAGIFTERDLSVRVVAADRNPATTRLDEVMTANPDTLPPDAPAVDALHLMREHNYRHLPVVKDGEVLGIVSIRDLYAAVQAQLEQDIQDRDAFIYGQSYSVGT